MTMMTKCQKRKAGLQSLSAYTLEFRLDGTKINGENNTEQHRTVIKQEEKGVI